MAKGPRSFARTGFRIAFDMDAFENRDVARAVANSAKRLLEDGFEVILETWERNHKGIDDALLANVTIQSNQGEEAQEVLAQMLANADAVTNAGAKSSGKHNQYSSNSSNGFTEPSESENEPPPNPLIELSSGCAVTAKLLEKSSNGEHMTHNDRFRLAQIAIGAGMQNGLIANLYRKQNNFDLEKTLSAIRSARSGHRLPSCKRIAEDLGYCDGNCPAKKAINGWSPNHLISKDETRVLPSIQVNLRQIRMVIKDAWKAIHLANAPEPILFNRLGNAVRLVDRKESLQIEMLGSTDMFGHLARTANWVAFAKGDIIPTKPDTQVASDMIAYTDDRLKAGLGSSSEFHGPVTPAMIASRYALLSVSFPRLTKA